MKEKRRSNEKRKEKSRDAARSRRSRETDVFAELAQALPLPLGQAWACPASQQSATEAGAHLDKASVMRLAIAYLKTRSLVQAELGPVDGAERPLEELLLEALDGFVLVLDANGDMVYLTPNVKDYLGIAQLDLMGQSVYDYSHPCDHDEIRESFALKPSNSHAEHDHPCNFFLRLKCTLTSKGRKVNLKSASYKVLHCTGRLMPRPGRDSCQPHESASALDKEPNLSLVVVASPVPHPSNIEVPLGKYTFLSKHNLNMKFTYADDKLADYLGWQSNELMGQSVFDFHHALDNSSLDKSFKSLFSKGQCETTAYRFLNKKGGYAWVVTQATLIHCSRLQKPLSVVCVNYLLSAVEREDEVYSVRQLEARGGPRALREQLAPQQTKGPVAVTASLFRSAAGKENEQPTSAAAALDRPETATASIFAPRTKDMNKGFLTFSEDQPGLTMLKDEPDDLTHLAPTAGDVCVPLEEPPFLSDMLDDFILGGGGCGGGSSEGYCTLAEEAASPPSSSSPDLVLDPFICKQILGVDLKEQQQQQQQQPASAEPTTAEAQSAPRPLQSAHLSEDEMLMMSIGDVMGDDELAFRAPYIPMSDQDETLQLLISDDVLMWPASQPGLPSPGADDVKWLSGTPTDEAPNAEQQQQQQPQSSSSLAQLLSSDYQPRPARAPKAEATERPSKRPSLAPRKSSHESLSKRLKHNHNQLQPSQLLRQLQHQDDGGGSAFGGAAQAPTPAPAPAPAQPPNSSSVLMNLLVSGCDMQAIQGELERTGFGVSMAKLTQQQQQQHEIRNKLSELQVRMEEQLQTVPQWTNNLDSESSCSDGICNSASKQHQHQTSFEPLSYDEELSFINSTDMLPDNDELLRALDSTLL